MPAAGLSGGVSNIKRVKSIDILGDFVDTSNVGTSKRMYIVCVVCTYRKIFFYASLFVLGMRS
jgi:hypothetical protein